MYCLLPAQLAARRDPHVQKMSDQWKQQEMPPALEATIANEESSSSAIVAPWSQ
jgi:hypothetical protein